MPATATPPASSSTTRRRYSLPRRLGPYRVTGKLGKGGMNHVLRAVHLTLGREVALKVLAPHQREDDETYRRFKAEARAGAAVCHPNILTCYDAARDQGWCFLAVEMASGGDLQQERLRRGGRLPERLALGLVRDIARGLEALHHAGFVHRDVKPANILLADGMVPKLADFGVSVESREQAAGEVIGSPGYMAPEQFAGAILDGRADCFALGVTCFELLTGELPFRRSRQDFAAGTFVAAPPPSARRLRRSLSPEADALLQRAMAIRPEDRFASAAGLAEAIDLLLGQPLAEPLHPSDAPASVARRTVDAAASFSGLVLAGF